MKINVKKLNENAKLPAYGSTYAAGADLYACEETPVEIPAGETRFIHTGIAVELPLGTVGLVYARSGLACKQDLAPANKVGVVDCDYRGEIMVALHNHGKEIRTVNGGDRIAQLVVAPYYVAEYAEADELSETVRGMGGFGSTGKN
ncbi:MAG: dUTP diphosphatase [Clostridia bacterium]|nr:dUTP diphosphatase [Clostridia bacterium]